MKSNYLFYLVIILTLGFSSCKKDDPVTIPLTTNIVTVDYNIFEPRVWYSDSIYVITNTVKIDASLTIQAGTIIKFHPDAGLEVWSNGTINAIGLADSLIIFTSIKDDVGGDSNKDLLTTTPRAGDWSLIDLGSQNGSHFSNCVFIYGGDDNNTGVLELGENTSTVEYCLFANNNSYVSSNIFYGALAAQDAASSTIIRHNTFFNNTVPLSINGHLSIDNSNRFINPDDSTETNTYNGIFVHGQDIISNSTTWKETEVAYVIQYDGFEIWENYTLTLGDDVVLKFLTGGMLDLQTGNELINGQGEGVYFTSFKDDNLKGDTNGDGNTTYPPLANDWLGIYNNTDFYTWSNILYSKNDF